MQMSRFVSFTLDSRIPHLVGPEQQASLAERHPGRTSMLWFRSNLVKWSKGFGLLSGVSRDRTWQEFYTLVSMLTVHPCDSKDVPSRLHHTETLDSILARELSRVELQIKF
jgi:hypothetical protein